MRILVVPLLRVRDADHIQHTDGLSLGLGPTQSLVKLNRLLNLRSDTFERIKAGHWVLHNHGDLFAADRAPLFLRLILCKIVSLKQNAAAGNRAVAVKHPEE